MEVWYTISRGVEIWHTESQQKRLKKSKQQKNEREISECRNGYKYSYNDTKDRAIQR